mmetsp:Transcript_89436/g.227470  ORF Transcript_89436/g.227470 Transcript_89436/m.227470 type:complete len:215 (+) Transcript_89436:237-881(+)
MPAWPPSSRPATCRAPRRSRNTSAASPRPAPQATAPPSLARRDAASALPLPVRASAPPWAVPSTPLRPLPPPRPRAELRHRWASWRLAGPRCSAASKGRRGNPCPRAGSTRPFVPVSRRCPTSRRRSGNHTARPAAPAPLAAVAAVGRAAQSARNISAGLPRSASAPTNIPPLKGESRQMPTKWRWRRRPPRLWPRPPKHWRRPKPRLRPPMTG